MKNADKQINGECINKSDPLWASAKEGGLTKREYFAGLAMAALISNGGYWNGTETQAITAADALLKELEK